MAKDILKLSIIIPVYNTPIEDLSRCIDSMKNQSIDDFSLIIVNDGSDDYIKNYLNSLLNNNTFKDLQIYSKSNSGVSDTRNFGIKKVTSEYFAFCDADDVYIQNFVEKIYKYILKYNAPDLIIGNVEYAPLWPSQVKVDEVRLYDESDKILIKESFYELRNRKLKYNINVGPYAKAYKSSKYSNLFFNSLVRFGEDQLYVIEAIDKAKNILVVNDTFYIYYQNEYSATRKILKNANYDDFRVLFDEYYKVICREPVEIKHRLYEFELRLLNGFINRTCAANKSVSIKDSVIELKKVLSHEIMKEMIDNIQIFNEGISFINSINVIFLRLKLYIFYIIEKKLIYFMGINKDKI